MNISDLEPSPQPIAKSYASEFPIVVWILTILIVLSSPLSAIIISYDGDASHHALLGKIIISDLSIPTIEPTAYTTPNKIFIAHEWLAEVIFGLFDLLLGPSGISLLATILIGSCLFIIALTLERNHVSSFSACLIIPTIFFLIRIHFLARPHLFSWLLFIFLYLSVSSFRLGKSTLKSLTSKLAIIFIIWANIHGSFIFGLFILTILLGLPSLISSKERLYISFTKLCLLILFIGLCTLANPFSAELHSHVLKFLYQGSEIRKHISEFGGMSLDPLWYLVSVVYLLILISIGIARKKLIFFEDYVLISVLILLSIYSIRMSPYLFLILPLIVFNNNYTSSNYKYYRTAVSFIMLSTFGYAIAIKTYPKFEVSFDENLLPVKGVEFLISDKTFNRKIFNAYEWGGYLAYMLYPNQKVFIHGLSDHYGSDLLNTYNQIIGQLNASNSILTDIGVKRVIFPTNTSLIKTLLRDPNWKAVYQDSTCVILDKGD